MSRLTRGWYAFQTTIKGCESVVESSGSALRKYNSCSDASARRARTFPCQQPAIDILSRASEATILCCTTVRRPLLCSLVPPNTPPIPAHHRRSMPRPCTQPRSAVSLAAMQRTPCLRYHLGAPGLPFSPKDNRNMFLLARGGRKKKRKKKKKKEKKEEEKRRPRWRG